MDPTASDPTLRMLAYVHPLWMTASLGLTIMAWRAGLALRRSRLGGLRRTREMRERHLKLAKPAVGVDLVGFVLGIASAFWLRGWVPLQTLHGWAALAATGLFVSTAILGRRIEKGESRNLDLHGWLSLGAMLAAGLAAFTGFVLLP